MASETHFRRSDEPDHEKPDILKAGDCGLRGFTASEALDAEMLANLPNDLARLFYLASLFDRTSHQYIDHSRAPRFGAEATGRAALIAHQRIFDSLAQTPLKDIADQLAKWALGEPESFAAISQEWRAKRTYRLLAPATALDSGASVLLGENIRLALELVADGRPRGNVRKRASSRPAD
jgi:hypothetical protein